MKGSKEQFMEMREEREWICGMTDEMYSSLPYEVREGFKWSKAVFPKLHEELYTHDKIYTEFYLRKKTASKMLDDYVYNLRQK